MESVPEFVEMVDRSMLDSWIMSMGMVTSDNVLETIGIPPKVCLASNFVRDCLSLCLTPTGGLFKIILFSKKDEVPPLFQALAAKYRTVFVFGQASSGSLPFLSFDCGQQTNH